ncbi:MAG: hypothetical protein M3Y79_07335 [Pseudomonadota bacterium]|nr:hypothetical protein [Pseudomonadota bacterium]
MNIRRLARAALIRIAALAGILIAVTLFINLPWFDEELHEDLVPLTSPRDVPLEGNAYPLVVGFLAAADQDPREAGLRIIEAQREHFRTSGHTGRPPNADRALLPGALPAPSWRQFIGGDTCDPRTELDCADRAIAALAAKPVDDPAVQLLMARYQRILEESRFEETQEFGAANLPDYGALLTIARLRLAQSAREADFSRVLAIVGEDMRFWKRVLEGDGTLMAKMLALAGIRSGAIYLSALMRLRTPGENELRQMPLVISRFAEGERDIGETFMAETRFGLLGDPKLGGTASTPLGGLLGQENATLNDYYTSIVLPLRLLASLDASEFHRQKLDTPKHYRMQLMPPPLYNLAGKQFVKIRMSIGMSAYQDYIARVHDVDGLIALVLLQAEIALNKEKPVEEVVAESQHRNPYTRAAMDYDAAAGTISFSCLARSKEFCVLRIR